MILTMNSAAGGGSAAHSALSPDAMRAAAAAIAAWPGYAPTPLVVLARLAGRLGLGEVLVKQEGARFVPPGANSGSFKALGPPYALQRALLREGGDGWRAVAATSGNHGRALAWGAGRFGAACTIFMPAHTSAGREAAIRAFGADVVRVAGDFDASLAAAARAAEGGRTMLVADLPWRGSEAIPRDILAGYSVLGAELAAARPSHVFVAAGNGSLAAAVATRLRMDLGADGPLVVSVEPLASDAVRRSLAAGRRVALEEGPGSVMDGLVVRVPSALCWPLLADGIGAGLAIGDDAAVETLRAAACGAWGDAALAIGETGIAALAGLVAACGDEGVRAALELGAGSRVVAIACEGVTDPEVFAGLLGGR
jgi:diaminopropionate ammonia-lyase